MGVVRPHGGSSHNQPHPQLTGRWFITQPAPSTTPQAGGSSQPAPSTLPGQVAPLLGSQDTFQATSQTNKVPADPKAHRSKVLPADSLLGGVCSTSAQREQKTRGRTSGTSSRSTPRETRRRPTQEGSSAPSCPAASESQQENDGQGVSVRLKSIFLPRSQALGLDCLKYTFYTGQNM